MNIIKQSISFIVLALSLLISACGGPDTGLSLVGDDNNSGGNPSPPIVDLLSNPKPPAPVITTAEATASSVRLKWTDESPREFGFLIIRDGVKVGETDKNISQWTDLSVLPATTYAYLIVAWNKEGEGVSQEKLVTTLSLPTPPKWKPSKNITINAFTINEVTGELYIGGRTQSSPTDAFLAKFNSDGTLAWEKQWGGVAYDDVRAVVLIDDRLSVFWIADDIFGISVGSNVVSHFDANSGDMIDTLDSNAGIMYVMFADGGDIYVRNAGNVVRKVNADGALLPLPVSDWMDDLVVYNGTAYYAKNGLTAAVDLITGSEIWSSTWKAQSASFLPNRRIAVNASGVYTFGENFLVIHHDFAGNLLWENQYDSCYGAFDIPHLITASDGSIYAAGKFGSCGLAKINPDGTIAWQTNINTWSLALFNETLFATESVSGERSAIVRYDALTGSVLP